MTTETLTREAAGQAKEADLAQLIREIGWQAREAAATLALASPESKTKALEAAARAVRAQAAEIIAANARDLAEANEKGLAGALYDRLALDGKRLEAVAAGLETVAALR